MPKQIINIPLTGGLDTKTTEKMVAPGSNLKTENVFVEKTGEIRKRNGYDSLTTATKSYESSISGGIFSSANAIYSYNDKLLLYGTSISNDEDDEDYHGPHVFSYSGEKWRDCGAHTPMSFEVESVTSSSTGHALPSFAESDDYRLVVYETGDGVHFDVIDKESGHKYADKSPLNSAALLHAPQCAYIEDGYGKHFVILNISTSLSLGVYARTIDIDAPTELDGASKLDICDTDLIYDMDVVDYEAHYDESQGLHLDGYSEVVVAYKKHNGKVGIRTINGECGLHRSIIIDEIAKDFICVKYISDSEYGDRIFVVFKNDSNMIKAYSYYPNLTLQTSSIVVASYEDTLEKHATIALHKSRNDDYVVYLFREMQPDGYNSSYVRIDPMKYDTTNNAPYSIQHAGLASKAFTYNNRAYVLLANNSPIQRCYFLVTTTEDNRDFVVLAKIFAGAGGGFRHRSSLSNVIQKGSNVFSTVVTKQIRLLSDSKREKNISKIVFSFVPDPLPAVKVGPSLLIGGAKILCFDGIAQEHGFLLYPENIQIKDSFDGGGSLDDGYRSFQATYQWVDRNGELQVSAPSVDVGIDFNTGGLNQNTELYVDYLAFQDNNNKSTDGNGTCVIDIYRTITDGTNFQIAPAARTDNDHTLSYASISDACLDTDDELEDNAFLYTTGGVLSNIVPPGSRIMVARTDRVFLVPMDDPQAIWYSKPKVKGIGVEFSDEMIIRIEQGGDITGLGLLDDAVIVFKSDSMFYFSGDGPNELNSGIFFSPVKKLSAGVGCKSANSIVATDLGLVFQSNSGIYLLDRSLQITYIGGPVEQYNGWKVKKAILVEKYDQIRFILEGGQPMLVWDYEHNQWHTWTNHAGQDMVVHNNIFYWVDSSGTVREETEDEYLDVTHIIPLKLRTPWFKLSGIQGYQQVTRAMVLGEYRSPHSLQVKVYKDYNDSVICQTETFDTTGGNHVLGEPYQFEFQIAAPQKCQSIMFEITDTSQSGTYESIRLTALSLQIAPKRGFNKLPDRKQTQQEN